MLKFKHLFGVMLAAVAATLCLAATAADDPYPNKPIRLVAPFPAGAPFDAVARRLAQAMSSSLQVPVFVDNKPGAGGAIGAAEVARAQPDGYVLMITISDPLITTPATMKVTYDPRRDFKPISKLATSAPVMLINPAYKSTTLRELIEEAKASKFPLSYGSFGPGSFPQLVMESFSRKAGVKFLEIPYRGAPQALQDMLSNQVAIAFFSPAPAVPLVNQGKARVLAAMGTSRPQAMPDLPTFTEEGFDSYFARRTSWLGLFGPARMPAPLVKKLNDSMRAIVTDPEFTKFLAASGFVAVGGAAEQFEAEMKTELDTVVKFIRNDLKIEPTELR